MNRPDLTGSASPSITWPTSPDPLMRQPATTGRYLVLFKEDAVEAGVSALSDVAGLRSVSTASLDLEDVLKEDAIDADAIVLHRLGVAITSAAPEQIVTLSAVTGEDSPILAVEPERITFPSGDGWALPLNPSAVTAGTALPVEYLRGYRAAVNNLVDNLLGTERPLDVVGGRPGVAAFNEGQATWGLQVTRVVGSRFSGRGVRVAVLDTGLDLQHPDFAGRVINSQSFVTDQPVQDGHGHGTHCIGTSCGPQQPGVLPRYGVAFGAEISAGKILSDQGRGADGWTLAGIDWALASGCRIVSMSLETPVLPGQAFSTIFENAARRALAAGTLLIAAAGNGSRRDVGIIRPVSHPANCPSIMAVAAIDDRGQVAVFSNGGVNPNGGQVDIAAPGVNVLSSWPMPTRTRRLDGTSMATPHVSGIAALHLEANTGISAANLWMLLMQTALRVNLPATDVGVGLVQAP